MSLSVDLPRAAASAQMPSQSSRIWKQRPRRWPASWSASAWLADAPARVAPIARLTPIIAPVLRSTIRMYSSSSTSRRSSKVRSRYWPSIMRSVAPLSRAAASRMACGGAPASAARSIARSANSRSASPALIAWLTPQTFQTVGRPRRCSSWSWMSSWTSEKLCTNSTAAAPQRAGACKLGSGVIAAAPSMQRAGRARLPAAAAGAPCWSIQPSA